MKWLVLGGGQLAKAFEYELLKSDTPHLSLNHEDLDITNEDSVFREIQKHNPDIIVNAAAWTNVDLAEVMFEKASRVNSFGPEILARNAKMFGCKLVHISTDYVFSGLSTLPWKESDEVNPISTYGVTKAEGENRVLRHYPEGSYVVRTAWLYSPWGKNFVKTMSNIAINNDRQVDVVSDQIGQPTLASDLVNQILEMIERDVTPGIYHGTNSGETSRFELSRSIFELLGVDKERVQPIRTISNNLDARRPSYSVLGHGKWLEQGIAPMRNWTLALEESLPVILRNLN